MYNCLSEYLNRYIVIKLQLWHLWGSSALNMAQIWGQNLNMFQECGMPSGCLKVKELVRHGSLKPSLHCIAQDAIFVMHLFVCWVCLFVAQSWIWWYGSISKWCCCLTCMRTHTELLRWLTMSIQWWHRWICLRKNIYLLSSLHLPLSLFAVMRNFVNVAAKSSNLLPHQPN